MPRSQLSWNPACSTLDLMLLLSITKFLGYWSRCDFHSPAPMTNQYLLSIHYFCPVIPLVFLKDPFIPKASISSPVCSLHSTGYISVNPLSCLFLPPYSYWAAASPLPSCAVKYPSKSLVMTVSLLNNVIEVRPSHKSCHWRP